MLSQLEDLNLSGNEISELPRAVYKLENLKKLDLSANSKFTRFDEEFLQLNNLQNLNCEGCSKLIFPPYAVWQQGLSAVKTYLLDYTSEKEIELTQVPVSFVGKAFSGKTSVIKSLQKGKRILTLRQEGSPLDETTKVFNIEEIQLPNSTINIIDHGGCEVYHLVHQLVIKDQFVPVVVVNMEEFNKLSHTNGPKEATRHLCFNWLSHLYLACPNLGSPILVLTHADKLSVDYFNAAERLLLSTAECIRREILEEERWSSIHRPFTSVRHLSDLNTPLFSPDEIFRFSNDLHDTSNIEKLRQNLDSRCKEFTVRLPHLWRNIEYFMNEQSAAAYISLDDLKKRFEVNQLQIILQYMHNCGRIFWFKNVEKLSGYIFHRASVITELFSLIFHHSAREQWQLHLNKFVSFDHNQQTIRKEKFQSFIQQFTASGVLDEVLLIYLVKRHSQFDFEAALALLQHFYIFHGPIVHDGRTAYLLPYFSSSYMEPSWERDKEVQLRMDLMIRGLSLPWYAFQLVTVAVLNHSLTKSDSPYVKRNGLTIKHGQSATHLVHDFNNDKITLQVSTPTRLIGKSWKRLSETTAAVLDLISKTWKACHVEVLVYCAHCLFLGNARPTITPDPDWFYDFYQKSTSIESMFSGIDPVTCDDNLQLQPSVPQPLRFPCKFISYYLQIPY